MRLGSFSVILNRLQQKRYSDGKVNTDVQPFLSDFESLVSGIKNQDFKVLDS
jgi:hypothetical protein